MSASPLQKRLAHQRILDIAYSDEILPEVPPSPNPVVETKPLEPKRPPPTPPTQSSISTMNSSSESTPKLKRSPTLTDLIDEMMRKEGMR